MILARLPKLAATLAMTALLAVVAGCGSGGFIITIPAHVRFFNALVDGGSITVNVGGNTVADGLPFEGITPYANINAGNQQVQIIANGNSVIYDTTQLYVDDLNYTFLVYGTSASPSVRLVLDQIVNTPGSTVFTVRTTNAAYGSVGYDLYITTPGVPLDNQSPNFSSVSVGGTTLFSTINAGTYQVRFTIPGSKQVIYDGGTVTFSGQTSYQIVAYTKGSSTLLNAAVLPINTVETAYIADSKLAQFKLVNAGLGVGAINGFIDGVIALANIPYRAGSSYEPLASGTHTVSVETVATPGATIASAVNAFSPATDTSVVLSGTPGATGALVFADQNLPGTAGSARVRFVNATTGVGGVDVYVNFAQRASNVGEGASSGYGELVENTYNVSFNAAGTTTQLLNLPAMSVTAGYTYTLYLMGAPGALSATLLRDG